MRIGIKTPTRSFEFSPSDGVTSIMVGNRERDDITIDDDPEVSGPHVRIENFMHKWSYTDQFSGDGTFYNGEKKYSGDLAVGDVLKIGGTELRILRLADENLPEVEQGMYNAHVHTPEDDSHPAPVSKELDDVLGIESAALDSPDPEDGFYNAHIHTSEDEPHQPAKSKELDDWPGTEFDQAEAPQRLTQSEKLENDDRSSGVSSDPAGSRPSPPAVFVERIKAKLLREIEDEHDVDLTRNQQSMSRIHDAALKAVRELEGSKTTTVDLPYVFTDSSGPKHLKMEIHRRHLHEEANHFGPSLPEAGRLRKRAKKGQEKSAATGRKLAMAMGLGLPLFIVGVVYVGSEWYIAPSEDEFVPTQQSPQAIRDAKLAVDKEFRSKVNALLSDKQQPPESRLDLLDHYEAGAKEAGLVVGWEYERVRIALSTEVYRGVTQRYNDEGLKIGNALRDNRYSDAKTLVLSFEKYLSSSKHYERAASVNGYNDSVESWIEQYQLGNSQWIADQLLATEEALSRKDPLQAIVYTQSIRERAILAEGLSLSLERYESRLAQLDSTNPVAKFDRKKDALPPSPKNSLLPKGDSSAYKFMSQFQREVLDSFRWGDSDGQEIKLWDLVVTIKGDNKSSLLYLTFTKEIELGVKLQGTRKTNVPNALPALRLAILMQHQSPPQGGVLAMMMYAFDNGLMDQAAQLAYQLHVLAPEYRTELDETQGAKWSEPIPEGGFPVRDDRIVPE